MIGFIWMAILGGLACFISHQKHSLNHWAEVKNMKVIPNIKKKKDFFPPLCPGAQDPFHDQNYFWKGDFFVMSDQVLVMLFKKKKNKQGYQLGADNIKRVISFKV